MFGILILVIICVFEIRILHVVNFPKKSAAGSCSSKFGLMLFFCLIG
jgi:hypothetical protein